MIRFECPACRAVLGVASRKAGTVGTCPRCHTRSVIPAAPPPAPAAVEVAPCPGCRTRLSVGPADLGARVECPTCRTVFTARRPGESPPPPTEPDPVRWRDEEPDEPPERPRRTPKRRRRRTRDYGPYRVASAAVGAALAGLNLLCGLGLVVAGPALIAALNRGAKIDTPAGPQDAAVVVKDFAGLFACCGGCQLFGAALYGAAAAGAYYRKPIGRYLTGLTAVVSALFALLNGIGFVSDLVTGPHNGRLAVEFVFLVLLAAHGVTGLAAVFGRHAAADFDG